MTMTYHKARGEPYPYSEHMHLWGQGVHELDTMCAIAGRPVLSVMGRSVQPVWSTWPSESLAEAMITFGPRPDRPAAGRPGIRHVRRHVGRPRAGLQLPAGVRRRRDRGGQGRRRYPCGAGKGDARPTARRPRLRQHRPAPGAALPPGDHDGRGARDEWAAQPPDDAAAGRDHPLGRNRARDLAGRAHRRRYPRRRLLFDERSHPLLRVQERVPRQQLALEDSLEVLLQDRRRPQPAGQVGGGGHRMPVDSQAVPPLLVGDDQQDVGAAPEPAVSPPASRSSVCLLLQADGPRPAQGAVDGGAELEGGGAAGAGAADAEGPGPRRSHANAGAGSSGRRGQKTATVSTTGAVRTRWSCGRPWSAPTAQQASGGQRTWPMQRFVSP